MFGQRHDWNRPTRAIGCLLAVTGVLLAGPGCSGSVDSADGSTSEVARPRPTDAPGLHDHSAEDSALAPETVLPEDIAELGPGPQVGELFEVSVGVNVCGRFLEIPQASGTSGIAVDAAGMARISPQPDGPSGHAVTVGRIAELLDIRMATSTLGFGGSWEPTTVAIGTDDEPLAGIDLVTGDTCGAEQGEVQLWYYTPDAVDSGEQVRMVVTDPQETPIVADGSALTIAFAPTSSLPTLPPSALNR